MRKTVSVIVIILSVCIISSCNSNSIDEIPTNALNTITNTTVVDTENIMLEIENTKTSDSISTNNDVETSYDFTHLNELGIYQLVENDILWKKYFYGEYSFKSDYEPQIAEIDNKRYYELSIALRDDIFAIKEAIQTAFGAELVLNNEETAFLCPFSSIQDLKNHMYETYTKSYIDYFLGYMTVIEYDSSLYIPDVGGVYPTREAVAVTILKESDTNILFSVKYNLLPIEGENLNVNYSAVYKNDKWVLDSVNNV